MISEVLRGSDMLLQLQGTTNIKEDSGHETIDLVIRTEIPLTEL